jgi:predicted O-methyltransferase YrrM
MDIRILIKLSVIFLIQVIRLKESGVSSADSIGSLRYFWRWYVSQANKSSPLNDERPWIVFPAADFLEKQLKTSHLVFEYGSGGSTLFFAKHANRIVSVEHDQNWAHNVTQAMQDKGLTNWDYYLVEPTATSALTNEPSDPLSYASQSTQYQGQSFADYAQTIDKYPDAHFDIILIDGRARTSCFIHSVNKVKVNGFLILDNAERQYYNYIHADLAKRNWKKFDFYGPGPYIGYFWQTCIWQRVVGAANGSDG